MKKMTVHKMLMNYLSKWFSIYLTLPPKLLVPDVNNPIPSQNIKHWFISPCPRQGSEKPDVYSERQSS